MITISSGDKQIYNPKNPYLQLMNPKLTLEDNAAGSLTFKIYESNLNYDAIKKLYPVIAVMRNESTIFKGRAIMDQKDFYKGKSVEVEGKLAFFNDSCMDPFDFSGTPEALFRMFVENHNAQVLEWQRFKVGIITVKDSNDYIVRSSEFVLNTWEALKSKCFQSSLGGHIRIRYEEDGDYVDWLSDYEEISSQSIEFAKNMIDLALTVDATETYTAIRPIGAEVEGQKIDISSVNEGKKYLINEEKAEIYGIIYAPSDESTWEDVTIPANLLKKAKEKLYGTFTTLSETYEINAIDLNLTDENIEALNIYEYVLVKSKIHNIDEKYLLNRAEIYIAEPQNSVYHLGASKRTFEDANNRKNNESSINLPKNISVFKNDANYVSETKAQNMLAEYTKVEDVEEIILQRIEELPSGKDGASAYESAVNNGFDGTEEEWVASLHGKDGENGKAPTITIGNVTTGSPGTDANVTNSGTDTELVLDFIIPQGASGSSSVGLLTLTYEETMSFLDSDSNEDIANIPNLRAIRDWCREKINGIESGGGDSSVITPEQPEEPEVEEVKEKIDFLYNGSLSQESASTLEFKMDNIDISKVKSIKVKNYSGSVRRSPTSALAVGIQLRLNVVDSTGKAGWATLASNTAPSGMYPLTSITDQEYTLEDLASAGANDIASITGFSINVLAGTSISYVTRFQNLILQAEIQYTE